MAAVVLTRRHVGLDVVRAVAIGLMVLDHVLVIVEPGSLLRLTVTRLSLPLFMACAALVHRKLTPKRAVLLGAVAGVEVVLSPLLGLAQPGIVTLYLVLVLALDRWPALVRNPYPLLVLGLLQSIYLPVSWAGYEPGLVAAWWAAGRLGAVWLVTAAERLRGPAWVAWCGARPLPLYVGHLVLLCPLALTIHP